MNKQETENSNLDILQDFVDNTSEIILMLAVDGTVIFANNAFVQLLGYNRNDLKSLNIFDKLHEQHSEKIAEDFIKLKNGQPIPEFLLVLRSKEKKTVYLQGDINCRYIKGEAVSFRCIMHDITLRRRAEKAQNLYYAIAQSNLNTKNIEEFLSQVHETLKKNIYANNFFVAIFEPQTNSIYFPYHIDEHYIKDKNYSRRKLGNGLVEYSINQNVPMILNKATLEELVEKEKFFIYESELPAVQMMVPLKINEKTIGVIGVKSYSDENKFTSRDLELLEFVSGQIAIAMERKKSEQDLHLQTARLNAIFDSSSHFIWTVNNKRLLSSFNKNYYNIISSELGVPPEINVSTEKVGLKLISPEDRPILREKYTLAFSGIPQYFEMNWGKLDGGKDWYEFYLNPILDAENGEIEEVSGIARNITEKKNAILSIQKSEQKFRNTIESFIDIYYRTDLAGNVTMISPSVFTHTGYTVEEVLNQKVDKFFENATDSSQNIKSLLKAGSLTNFEVNVKHKDGTLRQFILNIRMIKDAKGMPVEVEGVARDISELKKSAEDLKLAKEEAEHSLKVKEQFLANMSHEIRTPMNGIIGMIDVLNETNLDVNQKDYIRTIKKSSETLLTILNDILDLSKIEAGKMELKYKSCDLNETLNNLVALFHQKANEKNTELKFEINENTPKYILSDQIRLLQILSNLTSNAIKFTSNGTVNIEVSSKKLNKDDFEVKFEIKDTGIGISSENQKKLFNSFQQLDISTKKSFGGTGLGLVISKELSHKMGGTMGLISEVGQGSIFWFTIIAKIGLESEANSHASLDQELTMTNYFKGREPKILLVDDNSVNRKVASEILKKASCNIVSVDSGKKAIETFREMQDFDLILMDIQMPEMDGIETTQRLKQEFGNKLPKVVAMTAYSMQNDRENFLAKGLDDYISKPIRANVLIRKVEELISGKNISKVNSNLEVVDIEIPVFDMEVINGLKEMVGQEMVISVFEDFEKEAKEQIENTKAAFDIEDVNQIQRELHTLKGNSGTIGLMRIHEITKLIEEPSKKGNLDNFDANIEILVHEFELFQNQFRTLFA